MLPYLAKDGKWIMLLGVESWWEGGPWTGALDAPWNQPALPFARAALRRLHRKLSKVGERIGELTEPELHDLRLKAKKLRYAAEFFRGLFKDKLAALATPTLDAPTSATHGDRLRDDLLSALQNLGYHRPLVEKAVDSVLAADVSADQQWVALGGPDRVLKIYRTRDAGLEHRIRKHTDWVTAVEFSRRNIEPHERPSFAELVAERDRAGRRARRHAVRRT